jgi:hypothetical protein
MIIGLLPVEGTTLVSLSIIMQYAMTGLLIFPLPVTTVI